MKNMLTFTHSYSYSNMRTHTRELWPVGSAGSPKILQTVLKPQPWQTTLTKKRSRIRNALKRKTTTLLKVHWALATLTTPWIGR